MFALSRSADIPVEKTGMRVAQKAARGLDYALIWIARGMVILILSTFLAARAGQVEGYLNPIIGNHTNTNVHWDDGQFCWTWSGEKFREIQPKDFDHILIKRNVDGRQLTAFLPVTPMENGIPRPFEADRASPAGHTFSKPLCSIVPPWAGPNDTFDVEGTVVYPGILGLWEVKQHIPSIHHQGTGRDPS